MNKKLANKLATKEITQTSNKEGSASPVGSASPRSRNKRSLLAFRDSAIERIKNIDITFGASRFKEFKFDVSKGTSLKGLLLRVSRDTGRKDFTMSIWFNSKPIHYTIGNYPSLRCKDVEKICIDLADTHQDERGNWTKNPNETRRNSKRIIPKEDTTMPAGKTINEVIESYCGADEEEGHRDSFLLRLVSFIQEFYNCIQFLMYDLNVFVRNKINK